MQTQAASPQPPAIPAPAPRPVSISTQEGIRQIDVGVPMSAGELRAIRNRRENLSEQLVSAQRRRDDVAEALTTADPAARAGLQDRLGVLDARIVQLETDIAATGRQLTSAEAGRAAVGSFDGIAMGDGPAYASGLFTGIAAMVFVMWIRRMRRGGPRREQHAAVAQAEQLTRLEQAIDAIALEVERISEGQRFTAKLMADGETRMRREAAVGEG